MVKSSSLSPVSLVIRLAKALLSLFIGLTAVIIVFNNLTAYRTNLNFVKHVLSMDTTFPDNPTQYRAIKSSPIHHTIYISIICVETLIAVLCTKGGIDLFKHLEADSQTFHEAKRSSISGMLLALLLWFFGFQGIAAEWFGMWQSKEWNGLPDATRLTQFIITTLIFVSLKNDD